MTSPANRTLAGYRRGPRPWFFLGVVLFGLTLSTSASSAKPKGRGKAKPAPHAAAAAPAAPAPVDEPKAAPPPRAAVTETPIVSGRPVSRDVIQRESRLEFDERTVQGQAASGAVYLFERGQSDFRSMVDVPGSFRERTVRPILPVAGSK